MVALMFSAISSLRNATQIHASSTAFAALIWWIVPVIAVSVAIGYVIWTTKFKEKFDNETNRSVGSFQKFQKTLRQPPPE